MSASIRSLESIPPAQTEVAGVGVRHLGGAEDFQLKVIDVRADASTPFHAHPRRHDAVIVAGAGAVRLEDGEHLLGSGDVLSIASNEPHAILGRGPGTLRFVCLDSHTE